MARVRLKVGGGLIRETKIPVKDLGLKLGGGAYTHEAYSRDTTVIPTTLMPESSDVAMFVLIK